MLFTKECDYAIRIMRALSDGELVSVSNICAAEQLPSAMTYKITRKLEKQGLLKSCRGTNGGYERRLSLFYEQSAKTMSGTSGILPPAIHAFAGDASEIFI